MPGQPHLLARCVLKLREMMEQYVSFLDDTILAAMALPEGFFKDQTKITVPGDALPAFKDVPTEEVIMEKVAPLGGPLRNQLTPSAAWGADKHWGSPESVSQLEESTAPLLASYCHWTSVSSPQWVKAETPQLESWGKESLMPKGRRVLASQSGRARFHITSWVPRANARSCSTPRLWGSDDLPMKGCIAFNCLLGTPGALANRSNSQTHGGHSVC